MPWLRVHTVAERADVDGIVASLTAAGAVATSLLPATGAGEVLEPLPEASPLWRRVRVEGLFDLHASAAAVAFSAMHAGDVDFVADQDWSRIWRQGFGPRRFGRLLIAPKKAAVQCRPGDALVRLDPGLAFGTGTHPSTALCLAWLSRQTLAGKRVLDVGAGSGILAIAAARLGAEAVVAVDHDAQARQATADNARDNGVSPVVAKRLDDVGGGFDIVLANIVADTLCAMADQLTARADALVLSGLLERQAQDVMRAFPRIRFQAPVLKDGWALLSGQRRP